MAKKKTINEVIDSFTSELTLEGGKKWLNSYFEIWIDESKTQHMGEDGRTFCELKTKGMKPYGRVHRHMWSRLTCDRCTRVMNAMNRRDA